MPFLILSFHFISFSLVKFIDKTCMEVQKAMGETFDFLCFF